MIRLLLAAALLAVISPVVHAAWDEPHVEGTREHPLVKFYPQARVHDYAERDFDATDMVVGYKTGADAPVVIEIEGRMVKYMYEHKPSTAPLAILRNFEAAFKARGLTVVFTGRQAQHPEIQIGGSNGAFGVFRLDRDGTPAAWVNVSAYEVGGPGDPRSELTIVEIVPMEQKLDTSAATMLER